MMAQNSLKLKPDPALKRFFGMVQWAVIALGHNTQIERQIKVGSKSISRVSISGHSGYKREWGRFWKSKDVRRRRPAPGIKYDPAIEAPWPVAGRRTSEFLLKRFRLRKFGDYASFLVNLASYSGWVLGAETQTRVARRRGWVNVKKAVRWSEKARIRLTERALLNAAKRAGAKT